MIHSIMQSVLSEVLVMDCCRLTPLLQTADGAHTPGWSATPPSQVRSSCKAQLACLAVLGYQTETGSLLVQADHVQSHSLHSASCAITPCCAPWHWLEWHVQALTSSSYLACLWF